MSQKKLPPTKIPPRVPPTNLTGGQGSSSTIVTTLPPLILPSKSSVSNPSLISGSKNQTRPQPIPITNPKFNNLPTPVSFNCPTRPSGNAYQATSGGSSSSISSSGSSSNLPNKKIPSISSISSKPPTIFTTPSTATIFSTPSIKPIPPKKTQSAIQSVNQSTSKTSTSKTSTSRTGSQSTSQSASQTIQPPKSKIKQPTPKGRFSALDFVLEGELGKGAYGTVYLAETPNKEASSPANIKIAVKILSTDTNMGIFSIPEIDIMSRLVHPNLMPSFGLAVVNYEVKQSKPTRGRKSKASNSSLSPDQIAIKMPLAHSDLEKYLGCNRLGFSEKIKLMHDCALGLQFLHANSILNLDLKPENILIFIDQNGKSYARLTDFGLSIFSNRKGERVFDRELITITYRPPEAILEPNKYSVKSDIWSLGLVFLNILINDCTIFSDPDIVYQEILAKFESRYRKRTIENYLAPISASVAEKKVLVDLIYDMLSLNEVNRPGMNEVLGNSIFSSIPKSTIIPHLNQPQITKHNRDSLLFYRGVDAIFEASRIVKVKVETTFLAADIFQRSIPNISQETGNHESDLNNVMLASLTSFWIALKMIEDVDISAPQIVELSGKSFQVSDVIQMEQGIVSNFQGRIYRPYLYTRTCCIQGLLDGFEMLRKYKTYPNINTTEWSNRYGSAKGPEKMFGIDENDKFDVFYAQTTYFKEKSLHPGDYVKELYGRERGV